MSFDSTDGNAAKLSTHDAELITVPSCTADVPLGS